MTPKEKAKELFESLNYKIHTASGYYREQYDLKNCAKECAIITIDELLSVMEHSSPQYLYYLEVKQEIEKL